VLAAVAALAAPAGAQAHHTAVPVVTLDYRNALLPGPGPDGVRVKLDDAGRRLRLTVEAGHEVVVRGYLGEPFLRFADGLVSVNGRSPTARSVLRAAVPTPPVRSWRVLTRGTSYTWADSRVWAPAAALHGRERLDWRVPLVVDGRTTDVRGELVHVTPPAVWPWVVGGLVPIVIALAAFRRTRWVWPVAAVLAAAAGLATLAGLAGFAGSGLGISADRWLELALVVALTALALAFVYRPRGRLVAVSALAAFAVLQSLSELGVFRHGVVASALPEPVVRFCIAVALGCGLGAAGLAFVASSPAATASQHRNRNRHVHRSRKEQA